MVHGLQCQSTYFENTNPSGLIFEQSTNRFVHPPDRSQPDSTAKILPSMIIFPPSPSQRPIILQCRVACAGYPVRFFARAANDMPNRVRLERAFAKMFQNGLTFCKAALHFVDGEIPGAREPNNHDFGNATIYLTVDERPILWPCVFV